jgi:hypothetical protein
MNKWWELVKLVGILIDIAAPFAPDKHKEFPNHPI